MAVSGFLEVDVDTHGADHLFTQLAALTGRAVEDAIAARGPMLGRYLGSYTMPVADGGGGAITANSTTFNGNGAKAKALGVAAVKRDLGRVYRPIGNVYGYIKQTHGEQKAKHFWDLIQKNDKSAVVELLNKLGMTYKVMNWDGGALHREKRERGRVPKSTLPSYVVETAALSEYTKSKVALVGFGKSGWTAAGNAVPGGQGAGQAPKWMSQAAPARASRSADGSVVLVNMVSYVSEIMDERTYLLGLAAFVRSLEKEVAATLAYEIAKEVKNG